ncbi:MAG: class I SAM-dependent methyltransferase [Pseudomonadota bacterium]
MADSQLLFDQPYYLAINEARWLAAVNIIESLDPRPEGLWLDAACGPGWFSQKLRGLHEHITGFDVRQDLLEIARERVPGVNFLQANIEQDSSVGALPNGDVVLCFGLLYHLENPFAALRRLGQLTKQWMLLETMLAPGETPTLDYVVENQNETQGATYQATIPTRPTLHAMLEASGFSHIYRYTEEIAHADFIETETSFRKREIYLCGRQSITTSKLARAIPPNFGKISYVKPPQ